MKKIIVFPLCILLLPISGVFAEDDTYCGTTSGFALFECRVENICKQYKPQKPTIKPEEYSKAEDASYV